MFSVPRGEHRLPGSLEGSAGPEPGLAAAPGKGPLPPPEKLLPPPEKPGADPEAGSGYDFSTVEPPLGLSFGFGVFLL